MSKDKRPGEKLTKEIVRRLAEEGPLSAYDFSRPVTLPLGAEKTENRPWYSYVHGLFKKLEAEGLIQFYKEAEGEKGMPKNTYWLGEAGFLYALSIARIDKLRPNTRKYLDNPETLANCEVMFYLQEKAAGDEKKLSVLLGMIESVGNLEILGESPKMLKIIAGALNQSPTVKENGIRGLTKVLEALGGPGKVAMS